MLGVLLINLINVMMDLVDLILKIVLLLKDVITLIYHTDVNLVFVLLILMLVLPLIKT